MCEGEVGREDREVARDRDKDNRNGEDEREGEEARDGDKAGSVCELVSVGRWFCCGEASALER